MQAEDAAKKGIKSLSDLAAKEKSGQKLKFACNAEFYARADGLKPLQEAYGFEFPREDVKRMDTGLVYQALQDAQVDVGLVFATDGRVPAFNFVILQDDKGFFPNYAMTPVVRKEVLDKNPKLAEALNALSAKLDDATMAKLNASVDVDKKSVEEVAGGLPEGTGAGVTRCHSGAGRRPSPEPITAAPVGYGRGHVAASSVPLAFYGFRARRFASPRNDNRAT